MFFLGRRSLSAPFPSRALAQLETKRAALAGTALSRKEMYPCTAMDIRVPPAGALKTPLSPCPTFPRNRFALPVGARPSGSLRPRRSARRSVPFPRLSILPKKSTPRLLPGEEIPVYGRRQERSQAKNGTPLVCNFGNENPSMRRRRKKVRVCSHGWQSRSGPNGFPPNGRREESHMNPRKRREKRRGGFLGITLGVLVLAGVILSGTWPIIWARTAFQKHINWFPLVGPGAWSSTTPFDAEAWRSARRDWAQVEPEKNRQQYSKRFTMLGDLLLHYLHPGMTREEVITLLGPSNDFVQQPSHLSYLLGMDSWLPGVDPNILSIEFDGQGLLCRCRVYEG